MHRTIPAYILQNNQRSIHTSNGIVLDSWFDLEWRWVSGVSHDGDGDVVERQEMEGEW